MVDTLVDHPERALALSYAPPGGRVGLAALLALDDRLGEIVRTAREPLIGQMRLTWWHQALGDLDKGPPPAEPLLRALAADVLPHGVSGAALAVQVEGWEALLDAEPGDWPMLRTAARGRGAALFAAAGRLLDAPAERLDRLGEAWALADVVLRSGDGLGSARVRPEAIERIDSAMDGRLPRNARALGALALSARAGLVGRYAPGHPRRVARLAWHRLTGR